MLPDDVLEDILVGLNRRNLDALEIVSRALSSLIVARFDDYPRRTISLMFNDGALIHATPYSERDVRAWQQTLREQLITVCCPQYPVAVIPVEDLQRYIGRSSIRRVAFKNLFVVTRAVYEGKHNCCTQLDNLTGPVYGRIMQSPAFAS